MKKSGFIYLWTNSVNGKRYLGSHIGSPDDGYVGSGTVFLRAIKKHGQGSFRREILEFHEFIDRNDLEAREQIYLDFYQAATCETFYNVRSKAGGGWEYVNSCPILRSENIERSRGNTFGRANKGRIGRPKSENEKYLRHMASKRWAIENVARPIHRFDFCGNLNRSYVCIQDAAKDTNTSPSNILYAAQGRFKHISGWRWSFYETALDCLDFKSVRGRKSVHTPEGVFDKVTAVVDHFGLSSTTQVRQRCISENVKWKDWYYIDRIDR